MIYSWLLKTVKSIFLSIPRKSLEYYTSHPYSIDYVKLSTKDSQTIWALFLKPEIIDINTKFFLVCHGKGIDRIDATKLAKLRKHNDKNVSFLIIDYRGFGGSTGEFETEKVNYDLDAAIEFINMNFGLRNISLIGHSLGTGVILEYLQYLNNEKSMFKPNAVYLFAPFTSLYDCLMNFKAYRALKRIWPSVDLILPGNFEYNNLEKMQFTPENIFIFHGNNDKLIPVEHSKRLSEMFLKVVLKITEDDHDTIFGNSECWEIIFAKEMPLKLYS